MEIFKRKGNFMGGGKGWGFKEIGMEEKRTWMNEALIKYANQDWKINSLFKFYLL